MPQSYFAIQASVFQKFEIILEPHVNYNYATNDFCCRFLSVEFVGFLVFQIVSSEKLEYTIMYKNVPILEVISR